MRRRVNGSNKEKENEKSGPLAHGEIILTRTKSKFQG
jgi:hypothetical protein